VKMYRLLCALLSITLMGIGCDEVAETSRTIESTNDVIHVGRVAEASKLRAAQKQLAELAILEADEARLSRLTLSVDYSLTTGDLARVQGSQPLEILTLNSSHQTATRLIVVRQAQYQLSRVVAANLSAITDDLRWATLKRLEGNDAPPVFVSRPVRPERVEEQRDELELSCSTAHLEAHYKDKGSSADAVERIRKIDSDIDPSFSPILEDVELGTSTPCVTRGSKIEIHSSGRATFAWYRRANGRYYGQWIDFARSASASSE
jgi:hypothetical protein